MEKKTACAQWWSVTCTYVLIHGTCTALEYLHINAILYRMPNQLYFRGKYCTFTPLHLSHSFSY